MLQETTGTLDTENLQDSHDTNLRSFLAAHYFGYTKLRQHTRAPAVHFVPAFWIALCPGAVPELKYQYS